MVSKSPTNPLVIAGQALFYGLFAVIIGPAMIQVSHMLHH